MTTRLEDVKVSVKIKLSGLWTTVMFLYIYVDIMAFYTAEHIEGVLAGSVAGIQITPLYLLGVMILMSIPSFMVFISLALKTKTNRWVNIIFGIFHAILALSVVFIGGTPAYGIFGTIAEVIVLSLIVWYAWKWPTQEGQH